MKGHGKMENIISLKNIIVEFEDGERILKNISLDIKDKEFVTFLARPAAERPQLCALSQAFLNRRAATFSLTDSVSTMFRRTSAM